MMSNINDTYDAWFITINHYLAEMIDSGWILFYGSKLSWDSSKEQTLHFVGGVLLICLMIIWIIIPHDIRDEEIFFFNLPKDAFTTNRW
jgi:hypothetical protein